ncbi:ACP S-malonyltransferase [Streptomyces sp. HSG2]|uniref:ACP S-malonyltransferase n=1 Tax=Streptomyces sp. HSG2 TaxID=2797167 RepID=UPI0019055842|nr:ACP S-malonyltransferase [Streptomyces sp. HSG2]
MIAFIAPGQGSQTPGMLAGRLRDPESADRIRVWSEAADLDLAHLGTRASPAEIDRTENTQPLLVAVGLLAHDGVVDEATLSVGHSVGEITAAVYAGVLEPTDAVRLAAIRGRAMADACDAAPTSMAAVVGGEEAAVVRAISERGLTAATFNGAGQIVAAGRTEDLRLLAAEPPPGSTVAPLKVAGAFHTHHMESARRRVAEAAAAMPFRRPRGVYLSNADGESVVDPETIRRRLVDQVVRPVRWDLCLSALARTAPETTVALPPSRTLGNIVRRHFPELRVVPVNTSGDLRRVRARLNGARPTEGATHAGL